MSGAAAPPMLFALASSRAFGDAVARALGVGLAVHEERGFDDGEHKTRPLESVRGRDVYVLHSLYGEAGESVNDKLIRLLFFIGALKDAAAERVTAIVPYLAYARKDQKSQPRDPVATRYVAALFESLRTDAIVTLDVHNLAAYQNAFRCRTEHLAAAPLFVRHLAPRLADAPVAVVAPDAGGIKRAEAFRRRLAAALGRPVDAAFAEKHRREGVVSGDALVGDVDGRVAIVVDDLIAAGTTIARAAKACRLRGARRIVAAVSHGVFAPAADAVLSGDGVDELLVTDSIVPVRLASPAARAKVTQIGVASLFAEAIRRMHDGGSLVALAEE